MSNRLISKTHVIYTIAIIGFIYTLHLVIPMYSNSSFLSLFTDEQTVGYIFMTGAALSILGFLFMPSVIRRMGNYSASFLLVCIQIALFYGLVTATSPTSIVILFILQTAVVSLMSLTLDIFLEVYTDAQKIGATRGLYNATLNVSWVIAPLIGTMLIDGGDNYKNTYIAALAMLIPLAYLIYRNFPRFKDPNYIHLSPWQLIKHVSSNKNWGKLFFANMILQTFYSWMTIYCPIYLHQTIGFSWGEIGIILTIMLIPFVIIQYPLGKLADGKYGEKEIMMIGFVIMGLSTILLPLISSHSIVLWAIGLFMTRVGAAAAEIMIETYFFKTVSVRDSAALGVFRITRPISYFLSPLVTIIGLYFTTSGFLFAVIGAISLVALLPIASIRDTA